MLMLFSPHSKGSLQRDQCSWQRTDYDKLTLGEWTDSSVHPEDATRFCCEKLLKEQAQVFINFYENVEPFELEDEEPEEDWNEHLFHRVERSGTLFDQQVSAKCGC